MSAEAILACSRVSGALGDIEGMQLDHLKAEVKPSGGFFWLWILLTFIWIAISSSLAIESVITGALISAGLAYMFARKFEIWRGIRVSPYRLYNFILYTGVFARELVRANLNMMRYVWAPREFYSLLPQRLSSGPAPRRFQTSLVLRGLCPSPLSPRQSPLWPCPACLRLPGLAANGFSSAR